MDTSTRLRPAVSGGDDFSRPATAGLVLRHWAVSTALYGALLGFLAFCPFYRDILGVSWGGTRAIDVYVWMFAAYAVVAPVVLLVFRPGTLRESKNIALAGYLWRLLRRLFGAGAAAGPVAPRELEKQGLAFLLIKLYYGPLMLNAIFMSLGDTVPALDRVWRLPAGLEGWDAAYVLFVSAVFLADSALFFMGYHTEAGVLKNRLRYAETNGRRILVCVACYAPFNLATSAFFGPSNYDTHILVGGDLAHPGTWALRGVAVLALLWMSAASFSLFTKASNLTHRGIVCRGPYRLVRHPGYVGKNLFWLATVAPLFIPNPAAPGFTWSAHLFLCASVMWAVAGWGAIYYLRALTEEEFLGQDPEYAVYCRRVPYRFIPGVI